MRTARVSAPEPHATSTTASPGLDAGRVRDCLGEPAEQRRHEQRVIDDPLAAAGLSSRLARHRVWRRERDRHVDKLASGFECALGDRLVRLFAPMGRTVARTGQLVQDASSRHGRLPRHDKTLVKRKCLGNAMT
jgi:hypothetical protein